MHSSRHAEACEFCKLVKAVKKREEEKCEEEKREEAPHCDLLPSLNRGGGSQFIHPTYPSAFSRTGSGRGVEGFSSGRPDPRPAERAIINTMLLYKYQPHHMLYPTFERELAAMFLNKNLQKRRKW